MMTKKSEMAEWILDFFRKAKVKVGQIVMFRNLQFAQQQLNPKERSLFLTVINELLEHGYFTFEQEPIQCLRLTEKGYEYIYDEIIFNNGSVEDLEVAVKGVMDRLGLTDIKNN